MSPLALYPPIDTALATRNGRSGPWPRPWTSAVAGLLLALAAAAIPAGAAAQPPAPLTLEEIMAMAKRDFMGAPVTAAWWSVDARSVYYRYQPPGAKESATFEVNPRNGSVREVPAEDLGLVDADARGYDSNRTHAVYERAGDIWFRDIDQSTPIQVTRDAAGAADPLFSAQAPGSGDARVFFRRGTDWFAWVAAGGVETPVLALRAGPPPTTAPAAAPGQGVTVDLGPKVVIARSSLAPSGRHALVVTTPKGYDTGRVVQMPMYLTASGYPEMMDLGKQGWNMVSYPTGDHCFGARPDLQIDAYRRTFQLFERELKP